MKKTVHILIENNCAPINEKDNQCTQEELITLNVKKKTFSSNWPLSLSYAESIKNFFNGTSEVHFVIYKIGFDILNIFSAIQNSTEEFHTIEVSDSVVQETSSRAWLLLAEKFGYNNLYIEKGLRFKYCGVKKKWLPRPIVEVSIEQIQTLFNLVFNQQISTDVWKWKYANGRGDAVVIKGEEGVLAHCGAIYRDVLVRGETRTIAQLVDVMVHPKHRGFLTKRGPFFLATSSCIEAYANISYGFPNKRHMELGEKIGFYKGVDKLLELHWRPSRWMQRILYKFVRIDFSSELHKKNIKLLWNCMERSLENYALGVRDLKWLEYRYALHPENKYEIFGVENKLTGRWLCVVVIKIHGKSMELVDFVADVNLAGNIIKQLRIFCRERGCDDLNTWAAENTIKFYHGSNFEIRDPSVMVPTIIWMDPCKASLLSQWWLSPGDSDFH